MGAFINDTTPEAVAERLRNVAAAPASNKTLEGTRA
jgi:UDPglucose--hexose-1-phosphate uridylyltransferase